LYQCNYQLHNQAERSLQDDKVMIMVTSPFLQDEIQNIHPMDVTKNKQNENFELSDKIQLRAPTAGSLNSIFG
jgi:aspartate 1-decarboxylase